MPMFCDTMKNIRLLLNCVVIFWCAILCATAINEDRSPENLAELVESFDKWLELRSVPDVAYTKQYPPYSYDSVMFQPDFMNISYDLRSGREPNSKCSDDIVQVLFNLKSDWALQMLDSDGKLSSGVLQGGLLWIGKYEECASVYSPIDLNNHGDFHGQYCVTSWTLRLPGKDQKLPLTFGLCVPDSCSSLGIQNLTINILKAIDEVPVIKEISSVVNLTSVKCKEKPQSLDGPAIAYISVVCVFGILMLCGSLITVFKYFKAPEAETMGGHSPHVISLQHPSIEEETSVSSACKEEETLQKIQVHNNNANERTPLTGCLGNGGISFNRQSVSCGNSGLTTALKNFLLCFCVFTNGAKILNTDVKSNQMLFINGIRFLSLTWVIMGHSYISAVSMISNPLDVLRELDSFAFQALLQSPFSVDSFFLLSGFLLTFLFLKEATAKKGKINWIYFYIHRYWRLTPAYLMAVGFYMVVFKYVASGPFWDDHYGDSCRHTWWWYFLYISNFIPTKDMCIGWSWYLANDMQFYVISPLFLYALWRMPKVGLSIIMSLMAGSWIITAILSSKYSLIPMFVGVTKATDYVAYEDKMWYSFDLIYDKPYCRIGPYLIGVILGYILFKLNDRKNFMNVWALIFGWIIALFCSLSVVYGLYHAELDLLTESIYNALCRSSFCIGLAWIIFICKTGHGGPIDQILSLKIWIPLSRLTYCAYLFHPILVHGYYQALKAPLYFTQMTMVTNFFGFLVMGYSIAFVASLAFESPMMNLEKLVLKK